MNFIKMWYITDKEMQKQQQMDKQKLQNIRYVRQDKKKSISISKNTNVLLRAINRYGVVVIQVVSFTPF